VLNWCSDGAAILLTFLLTVASSILTKPLLHAQKSLEARVGIDPYFAESQEKSS
jgi:hypothetical protein